MSAMRNRTLAHVMLDSGLEAFEDIGEKLKRVRWFFQGQLDPNDWRLVQRIIRSVCVTCRYQPVTMRAQERASVCWRLRASIRIGYEWSLMRSRQGCCLTITIERLELNI